MIGDIAQLGERLPCTQEVSGSIPLISTNIVIVKFIEVYFLSFYLMVLNIVLR